ncbi:hypothetical protein J8L98_23100 [Pseudoalteromonas sp. MMG013]|uniref:hypothetical protein n=1 Tax=Pseudoalteromonas sp. MMG013 TaxID=2822687 RepID=UPI001B368978|nr:hypothetical protein [Pseudoalteromonas sp. MMG013]MBQ4864574.1 hypothetical protein [Pseudoalteromonas sp. MMG013]
MQVEASLKRATKNIEQLASQNEQCQRIIETAVAIKVGCSFRGKRACIALVNKNIRTAWAMLKRGTSYQPEMI